MNTERPTHVDLYDISVEFGGAISPKALITFIRSLRKETHLDKIEFISEIDKAQFEKRAARFEYTDVPFGWFVDVRIVLEIENIDSRVISQGNGLIGTTTCVRNGKLSRTDNIQGHAVIELRDLIGKAIYNSLYMIELYSVYEEDVPPIQPYKSSREEIALKAAIEKGFLDEMPAKYSSLSDDSSLESENQAFTSVSTPS